MTRFLLDSDILMDFFKKKEYAAKAIKQLMEKGMLTASILSISELRAGWNKEQAQFFLPRVYELIRVLNLSIEIAELAGKFRQEYKTKGVVLPAIDTLIAATAILEKCQLVTRNRKDFPMPEIKFYQIEE